MCVPCVRRLRAASLSLLAACGAGAQGIPDAYTLVELQPLVPGQTASVRAINNLGVSVGQSGGRDGVGTRWVGGSTPGALPLPAGETVSAPLAINDRGTVVFRVGERFAPSATLQVLREGGPFVQLVPPPIPETYELGFTRDASISSRDEILILVPTPSIDVGDAAVFWSPNAAGTFDAETDTALGFRQGDLGTAGLSDSGLRGSGTWSLDGSGGFITVRDPVLPTSDRTVQTNDECIIAGITTSDVIAYSAGNQQLIAYVEDDGQLTRLPPFGCEGVIDPIDCEFTGEVALAAINNAGLVVGTAAVIEEEIFGSSVFYSSDDAEAFIWTAETGSVTLRSLITDGSASGWTLSSSSGNPFGALAEFGGLGPADINDDGWIVGNGINPMGEFAAYLLIPRPPCAADVNRNGEVTPNDFNAWVLAFNRGCD